MPPCTWPSTSSGLITFPQSSTATYFVIFGSPDQNQDRVPSLETAARIELQTSIFGMHAAVFLMYATNLSVHQMMIKADVTAPETAIVRPQRRASA